MLTFEQTRVIYKYLQGYAPEMFKDKAPKLSPRRAFSVIYFLQEHLRIIPDTIERCSRCNEIFNTWNGGDRIGDNFYCDCCVGDKRAEIRYNQRQYRLRKKEAA